MTDNTALATTSQGSVFSGIAEFESGQRIAKALASSKLVPPQFQGQEGLANCLVALEIAHRMRLSPLQVMQNLHMIHGRPSWSSQFIIGLINSCGRFSPLQFELTGKGETLACTCLATEKASGKELRGPTVTMEMAKREGWSTKTGSKWQTMPELMIRYRAAAFYGRLYIPELLVGLQTEDEVIDIQPVEVVQQQSSLSELNEKIKTAKQEAPDDDELF